MDKLRWLNQHYMRSLDFAEIKPALEAQMRALNLDPAAGPALENIYPLLSERAHTLKEVAANASYFYTGAYAKDAALFAKHITAETRPALALLKEKLAELSDFTAAPIQAAIQATATELALGMGKVGMPLRVALTGGGQSPSIDITAELIGKTRCLERITGALA